MIFNFLINLFDFLIPTPVRTYMVCSSVNPDVLDLYVNSNLIERTTSGGVGGSANDTYMEFNGSKMQTFVDGTLVEEDDMTNIIMSSTGVLDYYNGVTLVERTTSA